MLPTSASRWAASVIMARLWARYPPARVKQGTVWVWLGSSGHCGSVWRSREGDQGDPCPKASVVASQSDGIIGGAIIGFFSLIHIF